MQPKTFNDVKLGIDNPSVANDKNLGQSLMSRTLRFGRIFKVERHSMFSQLLILRTLRFGKISSGRVLRELQLLSILKD
jgi:hypothetical protein